MQNLPATKGWIEWVRDWATKLVMNGERRTEVGAARHGHALDVLRLISRIDELEKERERPLASKLTFDVSCKTCRFCKPAGICRRYPPTPSESRERTPLDLWPRVGTSDWCGEWEAQKTL